MPSNCSHIGDFGSRSAGMCLCCGDFPAVPFRAAEVCVTSLGSGTVVVAPFRLPDRLNDLVGVVLLSLLDFLLTAR